MNKTVLRKALAEGLGVYALVFFGCGSLMIQERFPDTLPNFVIPIIFGIVIAVMIYTMGHISGAHFNPAVTIAFAFARHFPKSQIGIYLLLQFIGGILAMATLVWLLPEGKEFGATIPALSVWKSFFVETLLSFILMFVIISVATDTRAVGIMAGAAIGMTIMLEAFVGGPLTGASMNPARSLAPALWQGTLKTFWIYAFAPVLGTVLGAQAYRWIKCDPDQDEKQINVEGCC